MSADTERWDQPSERLRKIAATPVAPLLRDCPACAPHRHPQGERCGYPVSGGNVTCRCTR